MSAEILLKILYFEVYQQNIYGSLKADKSDKCFGKKAENWGQYNINARENPSHGILNEWSAL